MSISQVVSSPRTTGETRRPDSSLYARLSEFITGCGAFTYVYCLITGLAFWSPYMFWLAALVGGGPTARFWHPWLGLAFTAVDVLDVQDVATATCSSPTQTGAGRRR